ncbi:MAG: lipoyl synthase [Candidatus Diapherotrites archaeon]
MKPDWLKIRPPTGTGIQKHSLITKTLTEFKLNTVCEEAKCPNRNECWSSGTASFMILGDTCTRGCKFCATKSALNGNPIDENEPTKLSEAIKEFNLSYVVITSVTRDDLSDFGAMHFKKCVQEAKKQNPEIIIELLIPDFNASAECLDKVIESKAEVIGHNIETVKSLQEKVRDSKAGYEQSLKVLKYIKEKSPQTFTKSSLMLGLGETEEEILEAMNDLRNIKVDFIALGQYLQPSKKNLEVQEFITPQKFKFYEKKAKEKGFLYCASGPFVRSSYKAGEFFPTFLFKKKKS